MKITAILPGESRSPRAIDLYRITVAYSLIRERTSHVTQWLYANSLTNLNERQAEAILTSDIIVLARHVHTDPAMVHAFCGELRQKGAKLVYEADDDLTGIYRSVEHKTSCVPYLAEVDAITASVPPLAERLGDLASKPAYVIPNYLPLPWFADASYWTHASQKGEYRVRQYPDTVNLMLVGTPTHDEDWRLIIELIPALLQDYPQLRVLFAGHKPDYVPEHDRIVYLPPRDYAAYPAMLFEADIVCAGLDPDDLFNWAKSPIKVLESWAAKRRLDDGKMGGAAVIATDCVVYRGTIEDGKTGLLVSHTHQDWDRAIRTLIEDVRLRRCLQRRGYQQVGKYSLATHYREWLSVYRRITRG